MNEAQRREAAERLLKMAKHLLAEEPAAEEEAEDPKFIEKIRELKKVMSKLSSKKKRKLNQYNIGILKGTNTVEDLIDALAKVVAG